MSPGSSVPVKLVAKRAVGHEEGGHGGGHDGAGSMRWLLTYADLITLLMVFFIVLYSISQMDKAKYIQLAQALQASFLRSNVSNSLLDVSPTPADSEARLPKTAANSLEGARGPGLQEARRAEGLRLQEVARIVQRELKAAGLAGKVTIRLEEQGLVVSFPELIFFDRGYADLKPASRDILHRIAPVLAGIPNDLAVEGHTDDLPINTARYPSNWELSVARAVAVARYLAEREGLPPGRLSATGYGEWRPRFPNDTEDNRARNRRVDLVILRTRT